MRTTLAPAADITERCRVPASSNNVLESGSEEGITSAVPTVPALSTR
jgi:hypothetical protein